MSKPTFSIIIVTWNGLHHLRQYLPSVVKSEYPDFEIIIADNASTDETKTWVAKEFPRCKVVTFDKNYGYAGGNNRAVKYANGNILLFLNNDVKPDKHWLTHLEKGFKDPSIAVVQPKIRSIENPEMFEYAGASGGYIDKLGYPFCRGRIFDTVERDFGQYDQQVDLFWGSGAAYAIRKDIFTKAGGFDEDFEFHMEEIDLCWRVQKLGYRITSQPSSVVYHLGGGSLPSTSARKVFFNYRNSLVMLVKNLDEFPWVKIFIRLCLDGVAGIRFLLTGKPGNCFAIIRAHFAFYGQIVSALKKRKHIADISSNNTPIIYQNYILLDYFIKKKKTFLELDMKQFKRNGLGF